MDRIYNSFQLWIIENKVAVLDLIRDNSYRNKFHLLSGKNYIPMYTLQHTIFIAEHKENTIAQY